MTMTTTLLRMEFYPIQCVESMMMAISFRLNMLRVEDALEDADDDANRILLCISRYDDGLNCFSSKFIERTRNTCRIQHSHVDATIRCVIVKVSNMQNYMAQLNSL